MKKKMVAVFLAVTVATTTGVPVWGAEFSSPEEQMEIFSSGTETEKDVEELTVPEGEENENEKIISNEDEELQLPAEIDYEEYVDERAVSKTKLEIVKQPDITSYVYGVEARDISEFDLSGLTVKVTFPTDDDYYDTDSEEIKMTSESFNNSDSSWTMHDSYDNDYKVSIWYNGSQVKTHQNQWPEPSPLAIGEYTIKISYRNKAYASTNIWINSAENIPVLAQYESGKYSASVNTTSIWKYAKFIPEEDGIYLINGTGDNFEWGNGLNFKLYDDSMNALQQEVVSGSQIGVLHYKLQHGKEYYLSYKTGTDVTGINYKAELVRDIASLEIVEQPYENTYYISANQRPTWKAGKFRLYDMYGGKVKITYGNGEEEIIPVYAENRYGYPLIPFIEWSGNGNPKEGTYDLHFGYENSETEAVIKNGAIIKSYTSMPEIKENGNVTVPVSMMGVTDSKALFRLVTGNETRYIINSSPFFILSASIDIGGGETQWGGLIRNGVNALKPNTVYYICAQSNGLETLLDGTPLSDVKTNTFTVKAEKGKMSNCTVTIPESQYTYTGKEIKPYQLQVMEGNSGAGITLTEGVHYTVSYKNNIKCGTATITIKGKGSYSGTIKKTFKICLPKPSLKTIKKSGTSDIKITWAKTKGASGYEVYRLTNSTWKKISSTKSTSLTDKGLKKNVTYQYKIRAYQTVNGKKVYSSYSSVKKIKR